MGVKGGMYTGKDRIKLCDRREVKAGRGQEGEKKK